MATDHNRYAIHVEGFDRGVRMRHLNLNDPRPVFLDGPSLEHDRAESIETIKRFVPGL